jgi:epsilon-lactone hydrolase
MASWQAHLTSWIVKRRFKPRLHRASEPADVRRLFTPPPFPIPARLRITPANLNGVPGEFVEREDCSNAPVLLYLHGGGYIACSAETHRPITCAFAQSGFRVCAPDYRLAPEHPFPAAVEDAVASYRVLLDSVPGTAMCIAGDSAGGGLALALLLSIRDAGLRMPMSAVLFSPWTDLAATGLSLKTNDRRCAMFHGWGIASAGKRYLGGADPRNPLASPLYADLHDLPPLLIHAAQNEVLLDDSVRFADRAQADGVPVTLKLWPVVHHCWQMMYPRLPEARRSIQEAVAFLRSVKNAESYSSNAVYR